MLTKIFIIMQIAKCTFVCFLVIIFVATDALSPAGNIIMSSIGFFGPLLRIFKSFYSIDKDSSSNTDFSNIKHLCYEHLQSASNKEVEASMEYKRPRRMKKMLFFPEETTESFFDVTKKNETLHHSENKALNSIQKPANKTISPVNSTLNTDRLNNGTIVTDDLTSCLASVKVTKC